MLKCLVSSESRLFLLIMLTNALLSSQYSLYWTIVRNTLCYPLPRRNQVMGPVDWSHPNFALQGTVGTNMELSHATNKAALPTGSMRGISLKFVNAANRTNLLNHS